MTRDISSIAFALVLGLIGACGSQDDTQVTAATCVTPADPACRIVVEERSFVRWAGPVTDGIGGGPSTAVVRHAPGRFCMSGTIDSGPGDEGWGALLLLGFFAADEVAGTVTVPFDASALGIAQIRFSVEDPPFSGLLPQIAQLQSADCRQVPDCLATFGLTDYVTEPGTVTVPLTDFTEPDGSLPNTTLDRTLLTHFQFYVPGLPGMAFDYDLCLRDLAFLDAGGREITP